MDRVTFTAFGRSLPSYLDKVCDSGMPLLVTRRKGRAVVVMSEREYASIMETLHLLGTRANARRLLRSVSDADAGRLTCRELDDVDESV